MTTAIDSKRRPDIAAVIAGVIGVAALIIWIVSLLLPSPQDEPAQAVRDDKAQAALANQSPPVPREPAQTSPTPAPVAPPFAAAPPAMVAPPLPVQTQPRPAPPAQATAPRPAPTEKAAQKKVDAPPAPATRPYPDAANNAATKSAAPRPAGASSAAAVDAAVTPLLGRWVGTYSGSFESGGFTLELTGVSNGVISGEATLGGQGCRGRYPLVGTYKGEKLQMRAPNKGGPAGDCPLSFTVAPEGRWLMGATDSGDKIRVKK